MIDFSFMFELNVIQGDKPMEQKTNKTVRYDRHDFDKKLLAYSLTATAVLSATSTTNASIDHPVFAPKPYQLSTHLDFFNIQFGGSTKLRIGFISATTFTTTFTTIPISTTITTTYFYRSVGVYGVTTGAAFMGTYSSASALVSGAIVTPGKTFTNTGATWNMAAMVSTNLGGTSKIGGFTGKTRFLGIRFKLSGDTHYGWVKVEVENNVMWAKIHDYAYETTPDLGVMAGSDTPLAVTLSEFIAEQKNEQVNLKWTCETEVDNLGFIIERKLIDNNNEKNDWEEIASYKSHESLKGQGNTSNRTDYQFTDPNIFPESTYKYRLISVDSKGKKGEFRELTIEVQNYIPGKLTLLQNYPNPFNPETTIEFDIPKTEHIQLTIYNLKGQIVEILVDEILDAGNHKIDWDASNKVSGMYLYEIKADENKLIKKMNFIR
jgi:hypothetical protein